MLAVNVRAGWVDPLASTRDAVGVNGSAAVPGEELRTDPASAQTLLRRRVAECTRIRREPARPARADHRSRPAARSQDETRPAPRFTLRASIRHSAVRSATREDLTDADFRPRPLGGTTLLEGGVELRIPVWGPVVGALFVDGAILGEGTLNSIARGSGAMTPGFGVRYESPVGPIRVDLGVRPLLRRPLPVITQVTDSTGTRRLVDLAPPGGCTEQTTVGCRVFPDPAEQASFLTRLTRRLTLHLSIGQAF